MIRDLRENAGASQESTADVLVIGAGIAGLLAATRLARAGGRVVVVESGGLKQSEETHPLNEVVQLGDTYSGALQGRFRCLGGTSSVWGGAMLPFLPVDLAFPHTAGWNVRWPIALTDLTCYQEEVERLFRLSDGPYDFPGMLPDLFLGRLAKWPAFQRRNVATLLTDDIHSEKGPEIWLHATATRFIFDLSGRLVSVTMRSVNGGTLTVLAQETLIAAGAIESTRLLLLADRQHGDRIFAPDRMLGRYFFDHLSTTTARLVNVRRRELNAVVGYRF